MKSRSVTLLIDKGYGTVQPVKLFQLFYLYNFTPTYAGSDCKLWNKRNSDAQ
jgi:hypothetical protein